MKKYEFTGETKVVDGITLNRIRAIRDFGNVKAGDIGGWIEKEENLSHDGSAWVCDSARVFGEAEVCGSAWVCDSARVFGSAWVCDSARVFGEAEVYGSAKVFGSAKVCGEAEVYGSARVFGEAEVCGEAWVFGSAKVCGEAEVYGSARVFGEAEVCGSARVFGEAEVYGSAKVCANSDYIVFKNWWSSGRYFTWTKSNNMWRVGCFYGTGEELIKKAYKDSEISSREYERIVKYVESIQQQQ